MVIRYLRQSWKNNASDTQPFFSAALRFFQAAFSARLSAFFCAAVLGFRFPLPFPMTEPVNAASALLSASSSLSRRWISVLIAFSAGFMSYLSFY